MDTQRHHAARGRRHGAGDPSATSRTRSGQAASVVVINLAIGALPVLRAPTATCAAWPDVLTCAISRRRSRIASGLAARPSACRGSDPGRGEEFGRCWASRCCISPGSRWMWWRTASAVSSGLAPSARRLQRSTAMGARCAYWRHAAGRRLRHAGQIGMYSCRCWRDACFGYCRAPAGLARRHAARRGARLEPDGARFEGQAALNIVAAIAPVFRARSLALKRHRR